MYRSWILAVYLCGAGVQSARGIAQHRVVDPLRILRDRFATECVGAVHLRQDLRLGSSAKIPAEIRRNLKDQRNVIRLQSLQAFFGGADRRSQD